MLNPLPELLTLKFFAPALLRAAAALAFFYIAYRHYRAAATSTLEWLMLVFWALAALMLLAGYYTQIAALAALAGLVAQVWLGGRSQQPLPRSAMFLLIVICLSLLITGAGALAFDLPL
jgi:hypothetical protein